MTIREGPPCHFCVFEDAAYELFDGRLIGKACVELALREADRQLADAFDAHWYRLYDVYRRDEP